MEHCDRVFICEKGLKFPRKLEKAGGVCYITDATVTVRFSDCSHRVLRLCIIFLEMGWCGDGARACLHLTGRTASLLAPQNAPLHTKIM